jgi:anti-sigma-K factor RskA
MMQSEPFESVPDEALGRLLREHLDPGGHDAFVARVLAAARARGEPAATWDVLGRWSAVGVAAAVLLALTAALGYQRSNRTGFEAASVIEAIAPAEAPVALLEAPDSPGAEFALTSLVETQ